MSERRSKHLVLILAREFASNLATPTLIADDDGQLVFFNEAAEEVIGQSFAEVGEMPMDGVFGELRASDGDSEPIPRSSGRRGSRSTSGARRTSDFGSRAGTASSARSP